VEYNLLWGQTRCKICGQTSASQEIGHLQFFLNLGEEAQYNAVLSLKIRDIYSTFCAK